MRSLNSDGFPYRPLTKIVRGEIWTLEIPEDRIHLLSDFRALFISAHYLFPRTIFILGDPRVLPEVGAAAAEAGRWGRPGAKLGHRK